MAAVINSRFELRSTQSTDQASNAIKKYRKDRENEGKSQITTRWSIRTAFLDEVAPRTKHWLPIDPCWILCNANRLCLVEQTNGRLFDSVDADGDGAGVEFALPWAKSSVVTRSIIHEGLIFFLLAQPSRVMPKSIDLSIRLMRQRQPIDRQ